MALNGSLDDYSPAGTLRVLSSTGKTGAVRFSGNAGCTVYLNEGQLYFARGEGTDDALANALVRPGRITAEAWGAAVDEAGDSPLVGELLVTHSGIDPDLLASIVLSIIYDPLIALFRAGDGNFDFEPDTMHWIGPFRGFDVDAIVNEVRRRVRNVDEMADVVPSTSVWVAPVRTLPEGAGQVTLLRDDWELIASLSDPRSIDDLADSMGRGRYSTAQIVSRLARAGLLQVLDQPVEQLTLTSAPSPETSSDATVLTLSPPEPVIDLSTESDEPVTEAHIAELNAGGALGFEPPTEPLGNPFDPTPNTAYEVPTFDAAEPDDKAGALDAPPYEQPTFEVPPYEVPTFEDSSQDAPAFGGAEAATPALDGYDSSGHLNVTDLGSAALATPTDEPVRYQNISATAFEPTVDATVEANSLDYLNEPNFGDPSDPFGPRTDPFSADPSGSSEVDLRQPTSSPGSSDPFASREPEVSSSGSAWDTWTANNPFDSSEAEQPVNLGPSYTANAGPESAPDEVGGLPRRAEFEPAAPAAGEEAMLPAWAEITGFHDPTAATRERSNVNMEAVSSNGDDPNAAWLENLYAQFIDADAQGKSRKKEALDIAFQAPDQADSDKVGTLKRLASALRRL